MEKTLSTSFQLKRSKMNKKGQVPINMRITVDGKRVEIATHRMILPDNWDTKGNAPFGKSEESLILKNYLHSLKSKVQRQYNVLESMGEEITADAIKNAINGTSGKQHKLFDVFDYHNEQFLKRVGVDYAMSSYKLYTQQHLLQKS